MAIYSEDNPDVSSSVLLLSTLLNIVYMDGAEQVKMLAEGSDKRILFIDAVPDSKKVNKNYDSCRNIIKDSHLETNIHLIPVVCAEYYIIKSILDLGLDFKFRYKWYNIVLEAVLQKRTIRKPFPNHLDYKYKGNFDSFEQQCKTLLNGASEVFKNYNIKENKKATELNKISYFINNTHGISLYEKSVSLAKQYPVLQFKSKVPDGFRLIKDIVGKTMLLQEDYEVWKNNFKKLVLPNNWWLDENIDSVLQMLKDNNI